MVYSLGSTPRTAAVHFAPCPAFQQTAWDPPSGTGCMYQAVRAGNAQAPDIAIPGSLAARPTANCLQGIRLGVFRPWNAHADAEIRRCVDSALAAAQDLGAQVALGFRVQGLGSGPYTPGALKSFCPTNCVSGGGWCSSGLGTLYPAGRWAPLAAWSASVIGGPRPDCVQPCCRCKLCSRSCRLSH